MLTTDEGDLEVQLSSQSHSDPEEVSGKKKVTFSILEEATEDVDDSDDEFLQEPEVQIQRSLLGGC